jgi:hypothetical protein
LNNSTLPENGSNSSTGVISNLTTLDYVSEHGKISKSIMKLLYLLNKIKLILLIFFLFEV